MIGAVVTGVFFAIIFVIMLILMLFIKTLSIKCLNEAYKMYLLENGYRQPTKEELKEHYDRAVKKGVSAYESKSNFRT